MIESQSSGNSGGGEAEEALAKRAAAAALRLTGRDPDQADLAVVLTDDAEIARLNERYRGVPGPTDVLSFEGQADFPGMEQEAGAYLGDVIVSLPRAREQASAAGHGADLELAILVAHGTLHLVGYEHAEEGERAEMWRLQEAAAREALVAAV